MQYTVVCSDPRHPTFGGLLEWKRSSIKSSEISVVNRLSEIEWKGKYLFLVACTEFAGKAVRDKFSETIVFHASDLPKGRGWSPYVWEIEAGAQFVTLSMLRASKHIDAGDLFGKERLDIPRTAIYEEIADILVRATIKLMESAVVHGLPDPVPQDDGIAPSYYERRGPKDSHISAADTLESQFDRIRVCDPNRFPAMSKIRGRWFKLTLEAVNGYENESQK